MQSFEIKRGHGKSLEDGGLKTLMEEEFGDVSENDNLFSTSFKALTKWMSNLYLSLKLKLKTETNNESAPEDSLDAHQAYNRFMQTVTGFTARQRKDRAKAKAKREAKAIAEKGM